MILVKENIFVHTPLGEGVIIYVTTQSPHSNDIFTVGLKESGEIRHFESTQVTLVKNHTLGVNLKDNKPEIHYSMGFLDKAMREFQNENTRTL